MADRIEEPVVQVPVTAVFQTGGKYFVWVNVDQEIERRELLIGLSSDETFVVRDGLTAGEEVVLNPFLHFPDQITELRDQYPDSIEADPNWRFDEFLREEEIPETEEEFLSMVGQEHRDSSEPASQSLNHATQATTSTASFGD